MKLNLCVPAYNEEEIIGETVEALDRELSYIQNLDYKITVADNGSTDNTRSEALRGDITRVSALAVPGKGKGLAVRYAAKESGVGLFGFIDADLSADPASITEMLPLLEKDEADIVIGSRLLDKKKVHRNFLRTLLSEVFNVLRKIILGIHVRDSQCGLKIMNDKGRNVLLKCKEDGWFFDMELLALAQKNELRVKEIPVAWEEFRYASRGSKLKVLRDGFQAIAAMFRIRTRIVNGTYEKRSF